MDSASNAEITIVREALCHSALEARPAADFAESLELERDSVVELRSEWPTLHRKLANSKGQNLRRGESKIIKTNQSSASPPLAIPTHLYGTPATTVGQSACHATVNLIAKPGKLF